MNYGEYLAELLRPLKVYESEGCFQQGETVSCGAELDGLSEFLEEIEREMIVNTATDWGLSTLWELFTVRPSSISEEERKNALQALLRISGDSFTKEALNLTLAGCGTLAQVEETEQQGIVKINFPNIPGIPDDFSNIQQILENILPAHLLPVYEFWYITWSVLQQKISSFAHLDSLNLTWEDLESFVL